MFIRFCPENSIWQWNEKRNHEEEITPDDPRYWGHSLTSIQGYGSCGFVGNQAANYLLSKESGNIYCLSKGDASKDPCSLFSGYVIGSKILYGFSDGFWKIISEEDGKLKIENSDMVNFLLGETEDYVIDSGRRKSKYRFDKYGNILAGNKIYGYSQKVLTPDFGSDLTYEFDPYLGIIYTFYQGAFYVLEGLEFKKYNGVIFGAGLGSDDGFSNYFYACDEEGDYKIGYDSTRTFETKCIYQLPDKDEYSKEYLEKMISL